MHSARTTLLALLRCWCLRGASPAKQTAHAAMHQARPCSVRCNCNHLPPAAMGAEPPFSNTARLPRVHQAHVHVRRVRACVRRRCDQVARAQTQIQLHAGSCEQAAVDSGQARSSSSDGSDDSDSHVARVQPVRGECVVGALTATALLRSCAVSCACRVRSARSARSAACRATSALCPEWSYTVRENERRHRQRE